MRFRLFSKTLLKSDIDKVDPVNPKQPIHRDFPPPQNDDKPKKKQEDSDESFEEILKRKIEENK